MAVTLTPQELAVRCGILPEVVEDDSGGQIVTYVRATQLLSVATPLVEAYAVDAPEALQNEAVCRIVGYLLDAGSGASSEKSIDSMSVKQIVNHSTMFRNSGAAALLTRYKVRRAGAV